MEHHDWWNIEALTDAVQAARFCRVVQRWPSHLHDWWSQELEQVAVETRERCLQYHDRHVVASPCNWLPGLRLECAELSALQSYNGELAISLCVLVKDDTNSLFICKAWHSKHRARLASDVFKGHGDQSLRPRRPSWQDAKRTLFQSRVKTVNSARWWLPGRRERKTLYKVQDCWSENKYPY